MPQKALNYGDVSSSALNGRERFYVPLAPAASASNAKRAELPAFFRNDHSNGPRPVAVAAAPVAQERSASAALQATCHQFKSYGLIFIRFIRVLHETGIVEAAQPEYEIALRFLYILTAQLFTTRRPPRGNAPKANQFSIAAEQRATIGRTKKILALGATFDAEKTQTLR